MSDAQRRALERSVDPIMAAAALGLRLRSGDFEAEVLPLLVYLEYPGAAGLQAQLDSDLIPRRTLSSELLELELLSSAPPPERFCLAAWPLRLALVMREVVAATAREVYPEPVRAERDFPAIVSASLINAFMGEAASMERPECADIASALLHLREAPAWKAQGGEVPLELHIFPPLCRVLGREELGERVRAGLLRTALGRAEGREPLSGECHSPKSLAPPPRGPR